MIAFLNEYGYTIWALLVLMIMWVIAIKKAEGPPTVSEQQEIMDSLEHRHNSKWLHTTKSRWGED